MNEEIEEDHNVEQAIKRGYVIVCKENKVSNEYLEYCKKIQIPYLKIKIMKKYAMVSLDCITMGKLNWYNDGNNCFNYFVKNYFRILIAYDKKAKLGTLTTIGIYTSITVFKEFAKEVALMLKKDLIGCLESDLEIKWNTGKEGE